MLIFLAIVIVAVAAVLAAAGPASDLRRRLPSSGSGGRSHVQADWWPEFERQFWAYVRDHEHETH